MPEERGYRSQIAAGGPGRAVLADPDAFGAGIGRAIERGGDALHQQQLRAYRLDRQEAADAEAADAQRRAAEARVRMDQRIREGRTGPVPGAKGHAEAVRAALEEEKTALLDGIAEDSVRRSATASWDDYAARTYSGEEAYELGRGVSLQISNLERSGEIGANRITSSGGDKVVYGEELTQGYAAIDALQNVTPEEKDKLKRGHETAMTATWLQARTAVDPAQVKLELGAGLYDGLLTPEQVKALGRGADIEIKAAAVEAEVAASEARTAARNAVEAIEAQLEAGNIPSAKEAQAVIARARAAGVPEAELIRLNTKYEDTAVLRAYGAANDPTGARSAATVAQLDAKIRAGTASAAEYRLRDTLAGYADKRATDAADALKDVAKSGPAGQIAALTQIAQMPSRAQRFAAGQQLGGNNGYMALLPSPASRELAVNGSSVRKARPKDFGEQEDVRDRFGRLVGGAGPALGSAYGPLQDLAWDIYAGMSNAAGDSGWSQSRFDVAVSVAFGATKRRDGTLQGGLGRVRGRAVILPDNRTADEFDALISRLTFADAVYADGSKASKADVLARFRPEYTDTDADGRSWYRMIGPDNKPLRMKDGSVFPIRMPR